jgi:hypothetical protein
MVSNAMGKLNIENALTARKTFLREQCTTSSAILVIVTFVIYIGNVNLKKIL